MDKMLAAKTVDHIDLLTKHHVILLRGLIDQKSAQHVKNMLAKATELKIKKVTIEIASMGGDVNCAEKIMDAISTFPGKVTGLVRSFAISAAAVILQACHERHALEYSHIHFHHSRSPQLSLKHFKEEIEEIRRWDENLDQTVLQKSKLSPKQYEQLKRLDLTLLPKQALKLGFIDKMITAPLRVQKIISKAKPIKHNLQLATDYFGLINFLKFLDKMRSANYPPLEIRIQGDAVNREMVFLHYALLKQYPGHVTMIGFQELIRQSTLLLLAGDKRMMPFHGRFRLEETTIHQAVIQTPDLTTKLGLKLFKEQLEIMDDFIEQEYIRRSLLNKKRYRQMISNDLGYCAQTAMELGIIDEIIMPKHLKGKN